MSAFKDSLFLFLPSSRDTDLREGISEERRDRTLRTLIRNFYQYHLNEIYYVLR